MTLSPTIVDPTSLDRGESRGARLMVYIEGDGALRSQIVTLPEGVEVTVGRSRGCTVSVDSERISRRHLRIVRNGDEVVVEDLGSRNGTRVNGELISASRRLVPGDEISARPVTVVLTTAQTMRWRRRLMDATAFAERLRGEVDRGSRYKRGFALAMVRLEGDSGEIDAAIDQLCARVRAMDVLCDYGENEVALLLPELDGEKGAAALDRISDVLRAHSLVVRVGIASFPRHGSQPDALLDAARSALRVARTGARREVVAAEQRSLAPANVVAEAAATRGLFTLLEKVASSPMTVLVLGETGAGKEIAARTIHEKSKRSGGPFVVLNCACLPSTLLESELFGHEKGSFTGADSQKTGFFEAANGGTLFLDEIGEIEPGLQAKLLRVLESRKVVRVGGTREIPVDVRVVCATNRDLEEEISEERFRADLFYRIAGFTVSVPPLRERVADIEPLALRFISEVSAELDGEQPILSPEARDALLAYGWPGNVRELRNAVERATVLSSGGVIEVSDLPQAIAATRPALSADGDSNGDGGGSRNRLDAVERDAIVRALGETGGNQTHAARNLGLTRRALIYRMEKHGLKPKPKG